AEQEAAAGAGPNSLALQRRHQDVAERAVAIREVRLLDGTIAERTARLTGTEARIEGLEQQLSATGRFGRAAIRGDERAAVEADREALLRTREETVQELEQMDTRLQEVTRQAGPVNEHEAVLTEADMPQQEKAALLRRAKAKDNEAAKQLRAEAIKARSTAHGADHRVSGLQKETSLRAQHGRQHVDADESAVPSAPKPDSSYANRTAVDHTQPAPPDSAHDAPPV
ncbi:hypothetical protein ACFWRG_31545, partial [Micromonospora tulbaghiae]